MGFLFETRPYTAEEKQSAALKIIENALPDRDFYLLVIGAALFALFGITLDSIPVLIGAMIVAPLASPILGLSLGFTSVNAHLAIRSFSTLLIGSITAGLIAAGVAHFLPPFSINGTFISFVAHPLYDLLIAIIAGAIAAYGQVRIKVGSALTGIGVAISLMPPLVASAVALARMDNILFSESFTIFFLNVAGIIVGNVLIFASFRIKS